MIGMSGDAGGEGKPVRLHKYPRYQTVLCLCHLHRVHLGYEEQLDRLDLKAHKYVQPMFFPHVSNRFGRPISLRLLHWSL